MNINFANLYKGITQVFVSSVHFEELGCSIKGFRQVGAIERKGDMKGIYRDQALVSLSCSQFSYNRHAHRTWEKTRTEIEFSSDSSSLTLGKF